MRAPLRALPFVLSLATRVGAAAAQDAPPISEAPEVDTSVLKTASHKSSFVDIFASAFVGDGLRLNNPYRLATVLGHTAQSLSRTAPYTDIGVAIAFGDPTRTANGLSLRVSVALEGVPQSVLTPSYIVLHRFTDCAAYARAGAAIVVSPDATWGFEGAAGGIWFARAGIGLVAEVVGDLFYGAGTREAGQPTYPVLSGQGGLWLSWEALP